MQKNNQIDEVTQKAIKRICSDYDFENLSELKAWIRDNYGDILDADWFNSDTEEGCYKELAKLVEMNF